ncbi:unnamed protein product [Rotaria magnacalcarata]|uniref:Uncharacterized protein n=1 Tax=Rotaria magnacalcarata TaxID=392030 RepID=A0A820K5G8_9BILA|nr:unnamed protein product [Rotaria magnacalcarata]
MGSGCCKAKTIDASLDVVQTQTVAAREIPYDYVLIYSAASQEEHLSSDETAFVIPVEDVIHIYYTTDVKKSAKAEPHLRLVPVVEKKGCCGRCCKKKLRKHSEFGLKGINSANAISYPSPQELLQILNQSYYGIFGDLYQERLHSIQAQQAFRTHVPAPTTTRITAEIAMRPANKFQEGRKINYNIIQYY